MLSKILKRASPMQATSVKNFMTTIKPRYSYEQMAADADFSKTMSPLEFSRLGRLWEVDNRTSL